MGTRIMIRAVEHRPSAGPYVLDTAAMAKPAGAISMRKDMAYHTTSMYRSFQTTRSTTVRAVAMRSPHRQTNKVHQRKTVLPPSKKYARPNSHEATNQHVMTVYSTMRR